MDIYIGMKLINLLESILLEATPEEIYKKYYGDISFNTFKNIISADPGTKIIDDRIERIGPYSKMLLNIHRNGNLKTEDLPKATEYLTLVYRHKIPLDASKIKYISDIYPFVQKYYVKDTIDLSAVIGSLSPKEYDKVFEGNDWTIFVPKTEKASCYLGVNTEWCTTWGPLSLNPKFKTRDNRFQHHNSSGPLYIIIKNNNIKEKYQFHFPTEQYMDVNDIQINTESFLSRNPELKYFFFPSLTNQTISDEQFSEELNRLQLLGPDDVQKIVERISSKTDNKLVKAIVLKNIEEANQLITFSQSKEGLIDIKNGRVCFLIKLSGDLDNIHNMLSNYRLEKNSSYEFVRNDFEGWDNEYITNEITPLFKEYYKQNKSEVFEKTGIDTYEIFSETYLENFIEDIKEKFIDVYCDLNAPNFESRMDQMINEIENYIKFDNYGNRLDEVKVNIGHFVQYLVINNIEKIDNIDDLLENFIDYNDIPTDYGDEFYDWTRTDVKYKDMENHIERVFDEYFEESELKCVELRRNLNQIISKFMNGKNEFENEDFKLEIHNKTVDCEKESIFVNYLSKKTNEKFDGLIRIENLPQYFTTYKLFETILSFKRFL